MRKSFSADLKAKIALAALKEEMSLSEISSKYEVHRNQVSGWRKQALSQITESFKSNKAKSEKDRQKLVDELYRQIGQLKVENEWLKKKSSLFEH